MATDAIYNYMKTQNRPYSVNDIVTNLNNEFGKSVVQKVMDQLVTNGKLFLKEYGKQKIYCVVQDTTCDPDELIRIDKELQIHAREIQKKYEETMKEIKEHEALLSSLKSSLSLEELKKENIALQENITKLTYKLNQLTEMNSSEDLFESKRKAQKQIDEYRSEYLKRKRICTEIIDCILENYPGSKKDFYEEVGIDSTTEK